MATQTLLLIVLMLLLLGALSERGEDDEQTYEETITDSCGLSSCP